MYVSEIPMLDDNSKYADAYFLLHAQAGYGRMIGERFRFKLMAGMNNVTDAQYASMIQVNAAGTAARPPRFYYPGMPRNVYVNLELGLRL
ncbi:MAG: TonB-dependent receptor [Bacteroidetes bacterium]|nr:MAG: TonB-dependent receptor [Bacteroidota bacterium]